ncbi:uncharacterized protein [Euphorbia lathyris]|uniref:uncharacterized protein n=1 Tax=Euphorbia lathyris TaxID=212925 RepID=UPI0033133048
MKRMKGVAAPFEASPSSYATTTVYEDPRIRLRHQSLVQDYEDLYKETEAQKDKIEMMMKKKLALLAEVRFLKQRFQYLKQNQSQKPASEPKSVQRNQSQKPASEPKSVQRNQSQKPASEPKSVQRPKLVNGSRTVRKEQNHNGKNAAAHIDLNRKKKVYSEKEAAPQMRNPATIPDLNQNERIYSGKEASVRNSTPIFDLNQISMEEEELRANDEGMRIDEAAKICLMRGGSDEQHGDMKLSAACRSVGNGSSRAGKRKISWQDQVALRV